jgi:hypothetical protein
MWMWACIQILYAWFMWWTLGWAIEEWWQLYSYRLVDMYNYNVDL